MKVAGKVPKVAGNALRFFSKGMRSAGRAAQLTTALLKVFSLFLETIGISQYFIWIFLGFITLGLNCSGKLDSLITSLVHS